jgi:hypothetical protein
VPKQVGCRDYIAFAGLPEPFQSDDVGYVFRPEAQTFARVFITMIVANVYIVIVKDKLVTNRQGIFAEADKTTMLLPRSRRIHMVVIGLLQNGYQLF